MPTQLSGRPVSPDSRPVSETARPAAKWRFLGKLAPSIVIAWVIIDLLCRLLSPALLHLDPWLVVSRFPPRYAPFSPDQSFYLAKYIGGNAQQGNLPATEAAGPITFSTDHLGFRKNPYLSPGQVPQVLFLKGDSFTYGVALSDNQTLPSVMTGRYGIPSYNGGRFHDDPEGMPEVDWLLNHLPGRPSTIVYTYLEHVALAPPQELTGLNGLLMRHDPALDGDLRYLRLINTFFWELSPTRVITTRLFKKLDNDKFFPNQNLKTIQALPLPNGEKMLFRDYEFELAQQDRGSAAVAQTLHSFQWLKTELDKRHIRLIVLLVPNRYTIYAPLLAGNDGPWTHYLDHLNDELHKSGIESVNGLEVYRSVARQEVNSGHFSFYREDPHWNPHGVEVIAKPLAEAIKHNISVAGAR
jgi:SGNH hydrolase-like domain, acetyltransferase AlgX